MNTRTRKGKPRDRYLELIRQFPLRPIRDDAALDEAIAVINSLLDKERLSAGEKDYFDVLGDLIEKYEDANIIFEPQPPSAILRHLMEAKGVTQAQIAKDCRIAESTISEVLNSVRKLNRNHIAKLSVYFHVEPGVFFAE
ncbi:MAG: helix-turn-helix domain-containing protein [Planctomycetes bacterium]|jgi:HTH-type transcriptional regulator/antitoxin HigA|nr:helix-turn-helix domain-containing protein [Planctomycetota bacterium]